MVYMGYKNYESFLKVVPRSSGGQSSIICLIDVKLKSRQDSLFENCLVGDVIMRIHNHNLS